MKHIRVLIRGGKRKRLANIEPEDEVLGIILRSGRIVSLNMYNSSNKLFRSDFSKINSNKILDQEKAEKDVEGEENTKALLPHLTIKLKDGEYIPALGELKEAVRRLRKINYVRKILGLNPIPSNCWFLSSTTRDNETMWIVYSDGHASWNTWYDYYRHDKYALAFLKK